jgi:hypothetical protein
MLHVHYWFVLQTPFLNPHFRLYVSERTQRLRKLSFHSQNLHVIQQLKFHLMKKLNTRSSVQCDWPLHVSVFRDIECRRYVHWADNEHNELEN